MTSTPTLIGLIGRKGSGKDTAAAVLLARGYQNVKFAGALKDMLRHLLAYQGVDGDTIERMIEGDLKEVPTPFLGGQEPRFAMQTLGTEWGRKLIAEDLWVTSAIARSDGRRSVITDVRFPNERDAILEAGGVCFGITADWIKPTPGEHESEALIDQMIAALPDDRKMVNRLAAPGYEEYVIQEFQTRFLAKIQQA